MIGNRLGQKIPKMLSMGKKKWTQDNIITIYTLFVQKISDPSF